MFDLVRVEPATLAQHQEALRRLDDAWRAACPDAAVLIVTDTGRRWGLGAYTATGERVALDAVPWALLEETSAYFGLGTWSLARRGIRATCIRARRGLAIPEMVQQTEDKHKSVQFSRCLRQGRATPARHR